MIVARMPIRELGGALISIKDISENVKQVYLIRNTFVAVMLLAMIILALLINLRFDYEIYLSLNMPDLILKQEIPKMSLPPIVENAIYHGIEQIAEDTSIYIKGIIDGDDCVIEISQQVGYENEKHFMKTFKTICGVSPTEYRKTMLSQK